MRGGGGELLEKWAMGFCRGDVINRGLGWLGAGVVAYAFDYCNERSVV